MQLAGRKWVVYGAAGYPFYLTPFCLVPAQRFVDAYGVTNEGIALWSGKTFDWLYDEDQLHAIADRVLPVLLERGWGWYEEWLSLAQVFDAMHQRVMSTNLAGLDDGVLRQLADDYYEAYCRQYTANNLIEPLSYTFQERLENMLLQEGLTVVEAKEAIAKWSVPAYANYLKQCAAAYRAASDAAAVEQVRAEFHFVQNDFTGPHPLTDADLQAIAERTPAAAHEGRLLPEDLSPRVAQLLVLLQVTTTIQDVRKAQSLKWVSGADRFLHAFAQRYQLAPELALWGTWDEICAAAVTVDVLRQRQENCILHFHPHGIDFYTGDAAVELRTEYRRVIVGETDKVRELRGVTAAKGEVTGRAAVVVDPSEFAKVQPGDILVTVMTRPEYLPIMHLAAAFVTDEGGITSHAAIVAREMGKPCVIATKIGSKVIHDGDILEVDADAGVVRIVS